MKEIRINDKISYIECSEDPLSADVGIIREPDGIWLYDVGNDVRNLEGLDGKYNVVLSHFHLDHVGSLEKLNVQTLFLSKETQKHLNQQGVITETDV